MTRKYALECMIFIALGYMPLPVLASQHGTLLGHDGGWGEQRKEESGLRRSVSLSGNLRQASAWNLDPKLQIRRSIGELE